MKKIKTIHILIGLGVLVVGYILYNKLASAGTNKVPGSTDGNGQPAGGDAGSNNSWAPYFGGMWTAAEKDKYTILKW